MGSVLGMMLNIFIKGPVSTFWKVLWLGTKWFSAILFEKEKKNHQKEKREEENKGKKETKWTMRILEEGSSDLSTALLIQGQLYITKFPTIPRSKISYHYFTIWIFF